MTKQLQIIIRFTLPLELKSQNYSGLSLMVFPQEASHELGGRRGDDTNFYSWRYFCFN